MLEITEGQINATINARFIDSIHQGARAVSNRKPCMEAGIPSVLMRVNFMMLVSSLEKHGIDNACTAANLATRYFSLGSGMVENPWSERWRHILVSRDMTVDAKIQQLQNLLDAVEKGLSTPTP